MFWQLVQQVNIAWDEGVLVPCSLVQLIGCFGHCDNCVTGHFQASSSLADGAPCQSHLNNLNKSLP